MKLFIPDNKDGGTWETWKDDRPNYKAHAEALAEALRKYHDIMPSPESTQALAEWEKAKQ